MHPQTTIDIVDRIAEFIEPNVVVYSRLAMVNRDFYTVFTSDRLWAGLDVYAKKTEVFTDFMARLSGSKGLMIISWCPKFLDRCPDELFDRIGFAIHRMDNKYAEFGFAVHNSVWMLEWIKDLDKANRNLFFTFLHLKLQMTTIVRSQRDVRSQHDLAWIFRSAIEFYEDCPDTIASDEECFHKLVNKSVGGLDFNDTELSTLVHALHAHPRLVWRNLRFQVSDHLAQIHSVLEELAGDRPALLSCIQGMPEFLDVLPEYWEDQEVCLAALEVPWFYKGTTDMPHKFLCQCKDDRILVAAIEAFPDKQHEFPECLEKDKIALLRVLKSIYPEVYRSWASDPRVRKLGLWSDPEIIAAIVDGCSEDSEHYEQNIQLVDMAVFNKLCDNEEWIKQRVYARPVSWYLASERLQQSRELVMLVLNAKRRWEAFPPILGVPNQARRPSSYLDSFKLPAAFHGDSEMIYLAVAAIGLESIPEHLWTQELVKLHIRSGKECTGLFQDAHYKLARAAVLCDIKQLRYCDWILEQLIEDPMAAKYILDHPYEVCFIVSKQRAAKLFGNAVIGTKPDKRAAANILAMNPGLYFESGYTFDIDLAIEATGATPYTTTNDGVSC